MTIECQTCGAGLSPPAGQRTARCPYCASPSVIERPPAPDRPNPTFVMGFSVTKDAARDALKHWLRGLWFRRGDLVRAAVEDAQGVYVPAYLYSAVAQSSYRARIAEHYTETETYTVTVNGKTETRTRTVTKTEWRSLAGTYATYLADILVTASRGIDNRTFEAVEPFDLRALRRYEPAYISGWNAEDPSLGLNDCMDLMRQEAVRDVGVRLTAFMPGDGHDDLQHQTALSQEAMDLVLAPMWVFVVRPDPQRPPVRVIVNGQTARVFGVVPWSWVKITLAVVIPLALIAIGVWIASEYGSNGGTQP